MNKNLFDKRDSIILKGFLVIFMFWSHMFNHPEKMLPNVKWTPLFCVAGTPIEIIVCPFFHIAVPLFFFIGGYGFAIQQNGRISMRTTVNRIKKLYLKYWLVFLIFVPLLLVRGDIRFEIKEFLLNFVGISSSYCGEWWFLSTYIEILVCFTLIIKFVSKKINTFKCGIILMLFISIAIATLGYGFNYILQKLSVDTENLWIHEMYYFLIKQPMFVVGYLCKEKELINKVCQYIVNSKYMLKYLFVGILVVISFVAPFFIEYIPETYFYIAYLPIFVITFCIVKCKMGGGIKQAVI